MRIASGSTRRLPSTRTSWTTGSGGGGAAARARGRAPRGDPGRYAGGASRSRRNLDRGAQKLNRTRRAGGAYARRPSTSRSRRGSACASRSLWVTTTAVMPERPVQLDEQGVDARRRSAGRGCRWARPRGGGAARGERARASATRCCSPPDSSPGRCSSRSPRPTRSSISAARRRASPRGMRRMSPGIIAFSSAVNSGQQVVALEDEADGLVAEGREPLLAALEDVLAVEADPAAGRDVERAEQVQEGALPRAGRAR